MPLLSSSLIQSDTINIYGSSPRIVNNIITNSGTHYALSITGTISDLYPIIANNTIIAHNTGFAGIFLSSYALVSDNIITGWETGLYSC